MQTFGQTNTMEHYANRGGQSGVVAYEIRPYEVIIQFASGTCYTYTSASVGEANLNKMKQLARKGQGLSTFINKHLHDHFDKKRNC
jgi:hypothetical protein